MHRKWKMSPGLRLDLCLLIAVVGIVGVPAYVLYLIFGG